ncbi:MAG: hypothetical protein ACRC80_24510, partial [Waterburya sp.]
SQAELHQKTSTYIVIAEAYEQLGQPEKTATVIEALLELNNQQHNSDYYSTEEIAEYYLKRGNKIEALKYLNLALVSVKNISDYEERDDALYDIGAKFGMGGEYDTALHCAELIEDELDETFLYEQLVRQYIDLGLHRQVEIVIAQALKRKVIDMVIETVITEYLTHNDFEHATQAIESATNDQIKVFSLAEIARKYWELDNRILALKTLATAREIAERIQNGHHKSQSLKKISQVDELINAVPGSDLEGARNRLNEAVEKIQSCNSSMPGFPKVRQFIAIAEQYQKLHQSEEAKQLIDQAIESVTEINGCELYIPQAVAQSFAWNDIADYAMKYGQYEFVLEILEQIEYVDGKINLLINLSDIYIKENEFQQAEDTLDRAKEFLLKTNSSLALSNLMEIA